MSLINYIKTTWVNKLTPLSPTNMNKIENGIAAVTDEVIAHSAENAQSFDTINTNIEIVRLAKTATGSVNALAVDTAGTFDLTKNGNILTFIPNLTTTTTTPTIAVDGQTIKNIKKADDTGTMVSLAVGDIKKNIPTTLVWDSVNDFFILAPKGGGSNIKSIQRGQTYLGSSVGSKNITITSVDLTKSIVKIYLDPSGSAGSNPAGWNLASIKFTSNTQITIERGTTPAQTLYFTWEVIEYNGVKSKQSGVEVFSETSSVIGRTVTITSVNTNKAIVEVSVKSNDGSNTNASTEHMIGVTLSSSTQLTLSRLGGSGTTSTVQWQVIEFN